VFYDESYVLSHPAPQGLVFDLPSEGVSQMLSTLIKVVCGEAEATVTVDSVPALEQRAPREERKGSSFTSKRSFSTSTRDNNFKYLVVVGDMRIYVKTKQDLFDLRRDLNIKQ